MSEKTSAFRKLLPARYREKKPFVPVVRLEGQIMGGRGSPLGSKPLNLQSVAGQLKKAFEMKGADVVALCVNSPGGSPVQSRFIHDRIRQLADENDKKVVVFTEEVAASGGYWIACAGDEIIADPASIVGSIGVISASFGFTGLIEKLGVERRVYTAGQNKSTLDPFKPEQPEDVEYLKSLQLDIHEQFIAHVRERRGDVLVEDDSTFTGRFWVGSRAYDLGLVDGLGNLRGTMIERYGKDVQLKLVGGASGPFWRRLFRSGGGDPLGDGLKTAIAAVEERALWSRFGL
ncbi:MAG: S49 family peptidase [Pseudomonadota bacterium]